MRMRVISLRVDAVETDDHQRSRWIGLLRHSDFSRQFGSTGPAPTASARKARQRGEDRLALNLEIRGGAVTFPLRWRDEF